MKQKAFILALSVWLPLYGGCATPVASSAMQPAPKLTLLIPTVDKTKRIQGSARIITERCANDAAKACTVPIHVELRPNSSDICAVRSYPGTILDQQTRQVTWELTTQTDSSFYFRGVGIKFDETDADESEKVYTVVPATTRHPRKVDVTVKNPGAKANVFYYWLFLGWRDASGVENDCKDYDPIIVNQDN